MEPSSQMSASGRPVGSSRCGAGRAKARNTMLATISEMHSFSPAAERQHLHAEGHAETGALSPSDAGTQQGSTRSRSQIRRASQCRPSCGCPHAPTPERYLCRREPSVRQAHRSPDPHALQGKELAARELWDQARALRLGPGSGSTAGTGNAACKLRGWACWLRAWPAQDQALRGQM